MTGEQEGGGGYHYYRSIGNVVRHRLKKIYQGIIIDLFLSVIICLNKRHNSGVKFKSTHAANSPSPPKQHVLVHLHCVDLPIVALFVFGVHQLLNARPLINFFLPFPIRPSLRIVLQYQDLVNERAPIL